MSSNSPIFSFKNLSLCVYIGNTSSINDQTLSNYCSHFGKIISSSFSRTEKFCDFKIIEFDRSEDLEKFLNINIHEIDRLTLDVKSYKHVLINNDILNIDRKFFIGPIINSKDINLIIEFYKILDPILHYDLIEQDKQTYLLFEFNNRQSVTNIFEKQTIPITIEHRKFFIYKPLHPKQFRNKIISMNNKQNQIYIHGLTDYITETMLIDYFNKSVPVVACIILSNNSKCAVMEFNDKKIVQKVLDIPNIRLQGVKLLLSKATRHLASLLSLKDDSDDEDEKVQRIIVPKTSVPESSLTSLQARNQSPVLALPSLYRDNIQQQAFIIPTQSPIITEPILIPSPENNTESGWSSPPRTVFSHCPPIDQPSIRSSSKPSTTTTACINIDPPIEIDTKPIHKIPSNNTLRLVDRFQTEIDQIKDEYKLKFVKDRTYVEQEINLLINEERQTFDKLKRYINDSRRHNDKHNNKRKYSPSPITD